MRGKRAGALSVACVMGFLPVISSRRQLQADMTKATTSVSSLGQASGSSSIFIPAAMPCGFSVLWTRSKIARILRPCSASVSCRACARRRTIKRGGRSRRDGIRAFWPAASGGGV